jgi:cysteine synthase
MLVGSVASSVGETPLIRIKSLSDYSGCEIYGKAEFLNPGGSVKDRAARGIIEGFEKRGQLKPGGVIVEGTAGNTGIGLATLAAERGYRTIIVAPNNQAQEKYDLLLTIGADLRLVPPVPFKDENHFYHTAKRIAESTPGAVWANQFENLDNGDYHYRTTGPEIWQQMDGSLDYLCAAVGTGGTISGTSRYLKEKAPQITVVACDPMGSGIASYTESGTFTSQGSSITEGIGIMRLTANFASAKVDQAIRITDEEMVSVCHHVAKLDGLALGSSSGINLAAALKIALLNRNAKKRIVTILCDHGTRYFSKLYNPKFLAEKNLNPQPLTTLFS